MAGVTRRIALGLGALLGLGAVGYGASYVGCRFVPRNKPDFFALLDGVPDGPAVRRVGAAMMAREGHRDLALFAGRLAARERIRSAMSTSCRTTASNLVAEQCAADFAEGRTVTVDGWVLSATEAELCAARCLAHRA